MIAAAEQESADAITDETMAEEELVEEIEVTTDEDVEEVKWPPSTGQPEISLSSNMVV